MILVGYSWSTYLITILWVSLIIILCVIVYRKILQSFSEGAIRKEDYCELYSLELDPASGELPFYFVSEKKRQFTLSILDKEMNWLRDVAEKECKIGGNIIRFDSTQIPNGDYFYCLKTENQKIVKKMRVLNA